MASRKPRKASTQSRLQEVLKGWKYVLDYGGGRASCPVQPPALRSGVFGLQATAHLLAWSWDKEAFGHNSASNSSHAQHLAQ